ncbi:MAG: potassium-transporting ATPase subunit KdpA [Bacteroidetes bacterium]|nr:potassium-transporting ATPase subunit KdpA [Bacteroidota bacterium]
MKIAMIIALLHPFLILVATAISSFLYMSDPVAYAGWLNNPGFHGFSEMLYEFTSSSANNGSGFEGLGRQHTFLEYRLWYCHVTGKIFTNYWTCCYCRNFVSKKIYP